MAKSYFEVLGISYDLHLPAMPSAGLPALPSAGLPAVRQVNR
jgi:hypothetical protein